MQTIWRITRNKTLCIRLSEIEQKVRVTKTNYIKCYNFVLRTKQFNNLSNRKVTHHILFARKKTGKEKKLNINDCLVLIKITNS